MLTMTRSIRHFYLCSIGKLSGHDQLHRKKHVRIQKRNAEFYCATPDLSNLFRYRFLSQIRQLSTIFFIKGKAAFDVLIFKMHDSIMLRVILGTLGNEGFLLFFFKLQKLKHYPGSDVLGNLFSSSLTCKGIKSVK